MRALWCLAVFATGAASQALTFQFLFRSSRTAIVDTRFDIAKRAPNGDLVVIGRAGNDLLLQRWDSNANLLMTKTFDGPDKADERAIDVDVDNLNAVWVVYDTGASSTRLVRFDLNLNQVFDIPAGLAGESAKKIVVNAAREGIYCGVGVDSRDTFAAKVSGAGTQKWRRLVGRIQFKDADLRPGGDGIVMVGRNTSTQQGVVTAFQNSDGARPYTFQTADVANAANAIQHVATNRVAGEAYAIGFTETGPGTTRYKFYRIGTAGVAAVAESALPTDFPLVGLETAQAVTPISAFTAQDPAGGGRVATVSSLLAESAIKSFGSPLPRAIAVDRLGGSVFVSGDQASSGFVLGPALSRFSLTDLNLSDSYFPSPGATETMQSVADVDDFAGTGLGIEQTGGRISGVLVRLNTAVQWRVTNQVEQHPTRTVLDSAVDSAGAHYTLVKLGTKQRPSLIVKRSPTGQEIWQSLLADEGALAIQPKAIAASPNGSIIVAGVLSDFD